MAIQLRLVTLKNGKRSVNWWNVGLVFILTATIGGGVAAAVTWFATGFVSVPALLTGMFVPVLAVFSAFVREFRSVAAQSGRD